MSASGAPRGEPAAPEAALEATVVPARAVPDGRPVVGLTVRYAGRVLVQRTI